MITPKNLGIWLEAELNALKLYGAEIEIELYVKGKTQYIRYESEFIIRLTR
jgi:hypothetical protein